MIQDYIENICDILNIATPKVSYDTSNFTTTTMLAQINPSGNTIYLKKYYKSNIDLLFSIAHELRHAWQIKYNKNLYSKKYKPVELCASIEEYNLQLAEIDANAFAYIVMVDFFQIKPLFHGMSNTVKSKIIERVNELVTELSE